MTVKKGERSPNGRKFAPAKFFAVFHYNDNKVDDYSFVESDSKKELVDYVKEHHSWNVTAQSTVGSQDGVNIVNNNNKTVEEIR